MGALEQRMGVVEQEMQVLKAQIQTLLLEIQEQLLNNTYPTLRAQEQPRQQHAPEPSPAKRMTLEQIETDVFDDEDTIELPRAQQQQQRGRQQPSRQQQPRQARQMMDMDDYSDEEAEQQRAEYLTPQTDVRAWIEIDKWVSGKIKEIGISRTRELINLYGGQERDMLMQFLNVYEEEAAPPPPSPARSLFPQAERGTRPNVVPTSKDQWQKPQQQPLSAASRAKNATYTPFNEHQEMVLRLIADMVGNNPDMPRAAGSNGHNGAKH